MRNLCRLHSVSKGRICKRRESKGKAGSDDGSTMPRKAGDAIMSFACTQSLMRAVRAMKILRRVVLTLKHECVPRGL